MEFDLSNPVGIFFAIRSLVHCKQIADRDAANVLQNVLDKNITEHEAAIMMQELVDVATIKKIAR